MHPDPDQGEMAEFSVPGGMREVTRSGIDEAVEAVISGEVKKEVVWREEDVNHTVLEDFFGM